MRHLAVLLVSSVLAVCSSTLHAQKFQPKTIQFQGAPDYSTDDLLHAAGIKKGEALSNEEMQARTQQLSDTGIFSGIKYTFDGTTLTFQLTPNPQLLPIRLDNLPLKTGPNSSPDLDAKIHARQPLYRGKVPLEGTLLDGVKTALEDEIAAIGIKTYVLASPFTAEGDQAASAVNFSIATPQILIGEIQQADSTPLDPKAQAMLATLTGSSYSVSGTPQAIVRNLTTIYRDMGYLDTKVEATQQDTLSIDPASVKVPFRFSLAPGELYHVTAITLAPDMLVTQADFDKQSHVKPGDPADAPHIRENWQFLERQYHNKGYMKAKITPTPTQDSAQHTVSYAVSAVPGPTYTMGRLSIENVSDDIRAMMLASWKMQEGSLFNEGAILSYYAIDATDKNADQRLFRLFHAVKCGYTLHPNDDTKTVDVVLRLEKKS